ncbi:hypothetical protein BGX28_000768 [Mortierella sp. GBA30]|nr:hypothetical protein BGX28_000768 [Mortierella sp. GBA30]
MIRSNALVTVGTIGHVDHGKTTLTAALTTVLASKFGGEGKSYKQIVPTSVESAQGIRSNIARVEYDTAARHYIHLDSPTHEDYIKSMITGAAEMDVALLVCSATDGILPQTREQFRLARDVGVSYIVVFLNKCDLVDDEESLELVEMEVRELLNQYDLPGDDVPVIKGSAKLALGGDKGDLGEKAILQLAEILDSYIPTAAHGQVLAKPHTEFQAVVYMLMKEEGGRHTPFFKDYRPRLRFGTTDVTGSIELETALEMVVPGDNLSMIVKLIAPVAMGRGVRFSIREDGRTIGVGVVSRIFN